MSVAHVVRKIFFHPSTCGPINGPDAGGVLFTHRAAPRKTYAGAAARMRLLGVPEACVRVVERDGVPAYVFRRTDPFVAVAWCEGERTPALEAGPWVMVFNVMGNDVPRAWRRSASRRCTWSAQRWMGSFRMSRGARNRNHQTRPTRATPGPSFPGPGQPAQKGLLRSANVTPEA
jgi:hypothetical protein